VITLANQERSEDRFLGKAPPALQFENIEIDTGYQPGVFLHKIRRWIMRRRLYAVVNTGIVNADGQIRYDFWDNMQTLYDYILTWAQQSHYGHTDNIGMLRYSEADEDFATADGVTFTCPANHYWIVHELTLRNNTNAARPGCILNIAGNDFETGLCIRSTAADVPGCAMGSQKSHILNAGDTITTIDYSWGAGEVTTSFILYTDIDLAA